MRRVINSDGYISLGEAVERLVSAGILDETVKHKQLAIKKLLKKGEILGNPPPREMPQIGWEVNEDSLNEYIAFGVMTREELIQALKDSMAENKRLSEQVGVKPTKVVKEVKIEANKKPEKVFKVNQFLDLYKDGNGMNMDNIAAQVGTTRKTLSNKLGNLGWKFNGTTYVYEGEGDPNLEANIFQKVKRNQ